jgi:hypothetical protein
VPQNKQEDYANAILERIWNESLVDEDGVRKWEGSLMNYIKEHEPRSHDGKIATLLRQSRALNILVRGGGTTKSVYEVTRRALWYQDDGTEVDLDMPDYVNPRPTAVLQQQNKQLNKRVAVLETEVEQERSMRQELERRVRALEMMEGFGRTNPEVKARLEGLVEPTGTEG